MFLLFGRPEDGHWQSCINDDKWDPWVSRIMLYLGFLIDSHAMTVSWPLAKCVELRDQIMCILHDPWHETSPHEVASIIGKIRSAAKIAPWGHYLSQSSQDSLTSALRRTYQKARWFWKRGKMCAPAETARDLGAIAEALDCP